MGFRHSLGNQDQQNRNHTRRLLFETLEPRALLTFTHLWDAVSNTLVFQGTGYTDHLTDLWVDTNGTNTIHYMTDTGVLDSEYERDTNIPATALSSATPIHIGIFGAGENDLVSLYGKFLNFPDDSVADLSFWGEGGNDRFEQPYRDRAGPKGAIVYGDVSLVSFDGGDDVDTLNSNFANYNSAGADYPVYFVGSAGKDIANGLSDDDFFIGGDDQDELRGNGGNDRIEGLGEIDRIYGGPGNDRLWGHEGMDLILGEGDDDFIWGGTFADNIKGGLGSDTIYGEDGSDTIDGEDGPDLIYGGTDGDTIFGDKFTGEPLGNQKDVIDGGPGSDFIHGGMGNDTIDTGTGAGGYWGEIPDYLLYDVVYGDGEDDFITARLSGGLGGIVYLDGGDGKDSIFGSDFDDLLLGQEGNDTLLLGYDGEDIIEGGSGNDSIDGGADDDEIDGGPDNDFMLGGSGHDLIVTGTSGPAPSLMVSFFEVAGGDDDDDYIDATLATGPTNLDAGNHDDVIDGSPFDDVIMGGSGEDYLYGHDGKDKIYGGFGPDTLLGGLKDDELWSGNDGTKDQPYDGVLPAGGIPGSPDMKGTGEQGCDKEDGHADTDPGCPAPGPDTYTITDGPTIESDPCTLANDPADEAEYVIGSGPEHGTLSFGPDGCFDYTPDPGYEGPDDFDYIPYDTENGLEYPPTKVTINVVLPHAFDDAFSTDAMDRHIDGNVLANDTGGGMNGLVAVLVQNVAHGTLTLQINGTFEYTPSGNFYGQDTFTYRAKAGTFESNIATVTLTMEDPIVVAEDDGGYISVDGHPVDAPIPGVLGNDLFADTAQLFGPPPSAGTLDFNPDGSFTYTPPLGYDGTVTFQYTAIHTASGAQDGPATVTIDVYSEALTLSGPEGTGNVPNLQAAELAMLSQAAISRWRAAGVSQAALDSGLANVEWVIADLDGSLLAGASDSGRIVVDANAAGHGWFIDSSAGDDREFQQWTFASERQALAGSPAHGHVDLLTVLQHEIGHLLGLDHSGQPGSVMQNTLGLATRRWATAVDAALVELMYEASQRERRR